MKVLVTGGAGFLGSYFVREWIRSAQGELLNVDLLTYAGSLERIGRASADPLYSFVQADVADPHTVTEIFRRFRPNVVVHFAAESHVTRSERDPERFRRTNVQGTRVMLEAASFNGVSRFIHVSTDEVYGPRSRGRFREEDKVRGDVQATSSYAKSKSLADDLAFSFGRALDVIVVRPTNCFGAWQNPEKAVARWVTRALSGLPILVWGDGHYVRQWLHADDLTNAIMLILDASSCAPAYNVGPRHSPEISNRELATWLLQYLGLPQSALVFTEYDRPDHDERYAIDPSRIEALGWQPAPVWQRLSATVDWYRTNSSWWRPLVEEAEGVYSDAQPRA
jgi:dTDP-glucose 4,6-dehydratase